LTWHRAAAAAGVVGLLTDLDATVKVFGTPPETFNPRAYVVGYPRRVAYDAGAGFGVDVAELRVLAAAGPTDVDGLDQMLHDAKIALAADPTAAGMVQSMRVADQENWRRQLIAGADMLTADLILEIRM
jgi:hypothetical protein